METDSGPQAPQTLPVLLASKYKRPTPSTMKGTPRLFKAFLGLGISQIILGVLCLAMIVVLLVEQYGLGHKGFAVATALGIFFITTGSIGIAAAKLKKRYFVLTYMILCIVAAVLAASLVIMYGKGLGYDRGKYSDRDERFWNYRWDGPLKAKYRLVLAMYGLSIACCVAQLVIAVVASAFSCRTLYKHRRRTNEECMATQVGYVLQIPTGDGLYQPPLIIPSCVPVHPPKLKKVLLQNPDTVPAKPGVETPQLDNAAFCTDGQPKGDRTMLVGNVNVV